MSINMSLAKRDKISLSRMRERGGERVLSKAVSSSAMLGCHEL